MGPFDEKLFEREYPETLVEAAIQKARLVPREIAVKKVFRKNQKKGQIFAVTHDPRLPALGNIQAKHWRTKTTRDQNLAEVFKKPLLIAYSKI